MAEVGQVMSAQAAKSKLLLVNTEHMRPERERVNHVSTGFAPAEVHHGSTSVEQAAPDSGRFAGQLAQEEVTETLHLKVPVRSKPILDNAHPWPL